MDLTRLTARQIAAGVAAREISAAGGVDSCGECPQGSGGAG